MATVLSVIKVILTVITLSVELHRHQKRLKLKGRRLEVVHALLRYREQIKRLSYIDPAAFKDESLYTLEAKIRSCNQQAELYKDHLAHVRCHWPPDSFRRMAIGILLQLQNEALSGAEHLIGCYEAILEYEPEDLRQTILRMVEGAVVENDDEIQILEGLLRAA